MAHAIRHLTGRAGFGEAALRRWLLALVFCVAPLVRAQTPPPPERSLHFTVFSSRPVADVSYAPTVRAAPTLLVFYPTARSPRYAWRGPVATPLRFTDAKTGAVVVEVAVPPEVSDALIFLTAISPAPAKGPKYTALVIDDGAVHHLPGGLVVGNFSGLALSGTIDGKKVTLEEGLNSPLAIGRSAKINLRTAVKERSYQAYAGDVILKGKERALLLLLPPFYKGSLEVQSRLLIDEPPVNRPTETR